MEGRERFDTFYDMLGEIDQWEDVEDKNLVQNDIKIHHKFSDSGHMNLMIDFVMNWDITTVAALFYEQDLYHEWLRIPTGDPLKVIAEICPTLISLQAQVQIKWPIWDRWANVKAMTFFNPTCQGILQIIWSHDEGKQEFFGNKLPEQPENTVRIKMNKIYRYFEKIDDTHTRYL